VAGLVKIRRAILSVSDKRGLPGLAEALVRHRIELISTGGTARALEEAGAPVTPVERLTGVPEMLGGRVKTLHPKVHGGVLAIRGAHEHDAACREHGIDPIDLVCVNLYPFEATVARTGVSDAEAIEQIDIGGPALIRSGAKNHPWVTVLTSPDQYRRVIEELEANDGATTQRLRRELAVEAFARTSEYDGAIATHLSLSGDDSLPGVISIVGRTAGELRYGENPHQRGAAYRSGSAPGRSVIGARVRGATELGFNNVADAAAALDVVTGLDEVAPDRACAGVIKHATPCGAAVADTVAGAIDAAIESDPVSAFGGIVAINRPLDVEAAARLTREGLFFEVVVAPSLEERAAERLLARWKRVRLIEVGERGEAPRAALEVRSVPGGLLVQDADTRLSTPADWTLAAGPAPTDAQLRAAASLDMICRRVVSNAVVIGGDRDGVVSLYGAGGGQTDRVSACRIALEKAGDRARDAIALSDGFFPFSDGPRLLLDAGVAMLVHPGGSKRDGDTFGLCEERGVTCLTTGVRRFRH